MDSPYLSDEHADEIYTGSAVAHDVAVARGYRTLTGTAEDDALLEAQGFTPYVRQRDGLFPALYVPMHGRNGEQRGCQIKPADPVVRVKPDGTAVPRKYETAKGAPLCIDVPAFTRAALDKEAAPEETPLWITEGMKKVDSLCSQGLAAIGVSGVYNWRQGSGVLGDWEEIPIKGRVMVLCFDADAAGNRNVQQAMKRLGAWLDSRGAKEVKYIVVPGDVDGEPCKGVDDFFALGGTPAVLATAATAKAPGTTAADASFTDAFLVEEAVDQALAGRFCWASGLGWLTWSGKVWREAPEVEPIEATRQWASNRYDGVLAEQAADKSLNLTGKISGWRGTLARAKLKGLVELSRGIEAVNRSASDFDGDPDILTVKNGTVDLRTGELRPFAPEDCVTKQAGAEYRPGYTHPLWDKALSALPAELHEWYRDRLGQAVTGYPVPDHKLLIHQGGGNNGKSALLNIIRAALGAYSVQVSDRALMADNSAHPTELMDFKGARHAVLEETPEARHLNVTRLKAVVGTESITARRIRQDSVTFKVTHSLFINTNFKPQVAETDNGTWRRLALVLFPYTFRAPHEDIRNELDIPGDPKMEYVKDDPDVQAAALAWMVEGARRWYERDRMMLELPESVRESTRKWRAETDQVMGFADDCLTFGPDEHTPTQVLLAAFNAWTEERGHRPWNDKTFATRFGSHDVAVTAKVSSGRKYVNGRQQRVWFGVGIQQGPGPERPADGDQGGGTDPFTPPAPAPEPQPDHSADTRKAITPDHFGGTAKVIQPPAEEQTTMDEYECTDGDGETYPEHDFGAAECRRCGAEPEPEEPADGRCTNCGGEGGGGSMDPDAWIPCTACDETGRAPAVPFDIETGDADKLFSAPVGSFVKLIGVGGAVHPAGTAGLEHRSGGLVGVNNFFFDSVAMERHHGVPVEKTIKGSRDLRIAAFQNDPPTSYQTKSGPAFKSYSMGALAERYLPSAGGKSELGRELEKKYGGWDNVPADDPQFVEYLHDDLRLTAALDEAIPYDPYETREAEVCAVTARATLNGFRVDVDGLKGRAQDLADRAAEGKALLTEKYGFPATNKQGKPAAAPQRTAAGKDAFLGALLGTGFPVDKWPRGKDGKLSLSKDVMHYAAQFAEREMPAALPVIEAVQVMNGIRNNAANLLRHTHGDRVHPSFQPFQATGRWSIVDPGLTVLKKGVPDSERYFLMADPGEVLVSIDLDQIDIRCVAAHAQDEALLALLNDPARDIHAEIATMTGVDRKPAKTLDLGWLYGRQIAGMVQNTKGVTMEAAQRLDRYMRETFPRVSQWQSAVRQRAEAGVLLDNGFGRNLRCEVERAYTQPPAMIGQSATRDLIAEGLRDMARRAPELLPMLRVIVHDEVVLSVPEKWRKELALLAQSCLTRWWAPAGASEPVHITAGQGKPFTFGKRWGSLYED